MTGRINRAARVLTVLAAITVAGAASAQDDDRRRLGDAVLEAMEADAGEADQPVVEEGVITFEAFAEGMDLTTLIEYVSEVLDVHILIRGQVTGTVVFTGPKTIEKDQLLDLLEAMLDQYDYALTYDALTDTYTVQAASDVRAGVLAGDFATTKIINTPNVRPSALQNAISAQFGTGGRPGAPAGGSQIAYIDELGIIVVTDAPMRVRAIEQLVERLLEEYAKGQYIRFQLQHVAAPAARERALQLVSPAASTGVRLPNQPNQPQGLQVSGQGLNNLGDRLTIDPVGNALIFRGLPQEIDQVEAVLRLIDQPSQLEPRQYYAGANARQIADIASQRGLGEIIELSEESGVTGVRAGRQNINNQFQQSGSMAGGSTLVVNVEQGTIIYYATPSQHEGLALLIERLDTEQDRVVIEEYELDHADAEDVAEVLLALLENARPVADSPLLPQQGQAPGSTPPGQPQAPQGDVVGGEGSGISITPSEDVFVVADVSRNQILVKAPLGQQEEFGRLIRKLDERRPQVYIETQIVAVSSSEDFKLAVETQIVAGQFGLQTDFGLTSASEGAGFLNPRNVSTALGGLTTAVIKSEYVPIVINAIQTNSSGRLISSPQLLVDDNEEAEIVSLEQQATTTSQQGTATTQTSFGGYEDAGTTLRVTPSISKGGYMRLDYEIELSNFVGQGSNGIPPPRQQRNISSDSVTIPSDTTIVVGGIKTQDIRDTVIKVPWIGDIPLIGVLFRYVEDPDGGGAVRVHHAADHARPELPGPASADARAAGGRRSAARHPGGQADAHPADPDQERGGGRADQRRGGRDGPPSSRAIRLIRRPGPPRDRIELHPWHASRKPQDAPTAGTATTPTAARWSRRTLRASRVCSGRSR